VTALEAIETLLGEEYTTRESRRMEISSVIHQRQSTSGASRSRRMAATSANAS
jgi:hypothetical protein